jgi:hypothetical protein
MLHKPYPLSSSMSESPLVSFEEAGEILGGLHPNTIRQRKATRRVRHEETLRDLCKPFYIVRLLTNIEFIHLNAHTGIELNELCNFCGQLAGENAKKLQDERETPQPATRGRRMNQKTKTDRKATYCKRPFLLRSQKRDLNGQELKETRDIRMRENYGREGIEASGD